VDELKIGVIGAGKRGRLARHAHKPGEGARIVAICDTNPDAIEQCRAEYGRDVFATDDYRELLRRDLDAVFVCTPDFLHEGQAVAALQTGAAVYLEKPMTITLAGCDRVLDTAAAHGNRLFVGHNMRYMNVIEKMKQLIDEGAIGEVKAVWCRHFISYGGDAYFRDWHAERRYSTGLLLQKGAHDIDLIHWFAGGRTQRVSAMGRLSVYDKPPRAAADGPPDVKWRTSNWPPLAQTGFHPTIDVEDQSHVLMELDNGVQAAYLQCHFTPDACRNYTVIGTEGRLENIGDRPESPIFIWNRRTDHYHTVGDAVHRGDPPANAAGHGGADEIIVADFLLFALTSKFRGATPIDARNAVAAGCLATESLRDGGTPRDVPAYPNA